MSDNALPADFDGFADARKQGFLDIKNLKDAGKKVVGMYCTYTPEEIFIAARAVPVGICAFSDETIAEAEKVLPRNLCPLIKSSYGFAVTDKCPYLYFSDLIVGETTCDGKKKMYELMGEIKNVHVMHLPQSQFDEASQELWHKEILRLKERVEADFGVKITDEAIRAAIKSKNKTRSLLKEFAELSKLDPPPVMGAEQLKLNYGQLFKFDLDEKNVDESIEPYKAIADRYLQIGCSVMTPNTNRYDLLTQLCKDFKVDGVVEMVLTACHTYAIETAEIRKLMQSQDIPFISVETDYSTSDAAQLKTRLAAFLEMM